ncbi:MAG TPA: hypothetical protein VM925_17470, partial [Labilithrix sp.]|nr:hypothetical protein [Labilithrix sp.]
MIEADLVRLETTSGDPFRGGGVAAGPHCRHEIRPDERVVRHRDDAHSRVAADLAERAELLQIHVFRT